MGILKFGKTIGSSKFSIREKLRAKKLAKKKAEAERQRTIIGSCIGYLEKKFNDILKDVYAMEDELHKMQSELDIIAQNGGRKEDIIRLQRKFNWLNTSRVFKYKACDGIYKILFAFYKLEALTEYLYAHDWYKYFKYLRGFEFDEKIKNELGSFDVVATEINNLFQRILERVQDEFEDAKEFEKLAKDIEREAGIRASKLDMPIFNDIFHDIPTDSDPSWFIVEEYPIKNPTYIKNEA